MQRVATVVTRFIAGAGGVALRGALALDPERYAITILAAPGGPLLEQAEQAGFEVVRLRHLVPEINLREDFAALRELTDELGRRDFDIVHTHSSKAGTLGRMAAHRVGVPGIVHTFHGFPFHDFQSRWRRAAYIAIERRLGRITDRFLAIGGAVAADAVRLRIAGPHQVRAIAPAIASAAITPATAASRARARALMSIPADAQVVGTVGRLDFQKAPQHMLEAFRILDRPRVRFVWIGGGPLRSRIEARVARLGLQSRFVLLGERADVADLLPGLDVFALSSLYEGLPCAAVEAMTCGVPVVATAVNAVPEIVIPGKSGLLVRPAAPAELAQALAYTLDNPTEAARMAAAARTLVRERFDPSVLGAELVETYQQALHSPERGRGGAVAMVQAV